ncbi:MAG: hypothetical protein RL199_316 [Pseudomonadota bacterium]|jgi:hypothetical protein
MRRLVPACIAAACAHAPPTDRPVTTYERTTPVLHWDEETETSGLAYAFEADLLDGVLGLRTATARPDAATRWLAACPTPTGGRVLGDGLAPAGLPPEVAAWIAVSEWQSGAAGVRSSSESSSVVAASGLESQRQRTDGRARFRVGRVDCVRLTRTSDALSVSNDSPLSNAIRDFGSPRQEDLEAVGLVHERGLVVGRMGRVEGGYELSLHVSGLTNALSVSAVASDWSLLCRSDAPIYVRELPVALSGEPVGEACRVGAGPVEGASEVK